MRRRSVDAALAHPPVHVIHQDPMTNHQGIIMERFGLSASNAFSVMSRLSQDTNTKLVAVAEQIITTRRIPGTS